MRSPVIRTTVHGVQLGSGRERSDADGQPWPRASAMSRLRLSSSSTRPLRAVLRIDYERFDAAGADSIDEASGRMQSRN